MASYSEIWGVQGGFQENKAVSVELFLTTFVSLRENLLCHVKNEYLFCVRVKNSYAGDLHILV